jgi:quinol monooxygenase YgiN
MAQTVRFTVELTIGEDAFGAFEEIVDAMIAGSSEEPGTVVYEFTLSDDRRRARIIEGFDGPDGVLAHMQGSVVADLVPRMLEVTTIEGFTVDGDPGPEATEILRGFGAEIFPHWKVLSRTG